MRFLLSIDIVSSNVVPNFQMLVLLGG